MVMDVVKPFAQLNYMLIIMSICKPNRPVIIFNFEKRGMRASRYIEYYWNPGDTLNDS